MLRVPAEFPHVGATAYLRGTAEPVRILRRNADRTFLIEKLRRTPWGEPVRDHDRAASGNREVPEADLCETERDAMDIAPRPRRRERKAAAPKPRKSRRGTNLVGQGA